MTPLSLLLLQVLVGECPEHLEGRLGMRDSILAIPVTQGLLGYLYFESQVDELHSLLQIEMSPPSEDFLVSDEVDNLSRDLGLCSLDL